LVVPLIPRGNHPGRRRTVAVRDVISGEMYVGFVIGVIFEGAKADVMGHILLTRLVRIYRSLLWRS